VTRKILVIIRKYYMHSVLKSRPSNTKSEFGIRLDYAVVIRIDLDPITKNAQCPLAFKDSRELPSNCLGQNWKGLRPFIDLTIPALVCTKESSPKGCLLIVDRNCHMIGSWSIGLGI